MTCELSPQAAPCNLLPQASLSDLSPQAKRSDLSSQAATRDLLPQANLSDLSPPARLSDLSPPARLSDLSPQVRLSLFEKLRMSQGIWLQSDIEQSDVHNVLVRQPLGTFLVWTDKCGKRKLAMRQSDGNNPIVTDYIIREEAEVYFLENSLLGFGDLFQLIGYYCVSRDVLPHRLCVPPALLEPSHCQPALETLSSLGMIFWDSPFNLPEDPHPQVPLTVTDLPEPNTAPTLELLKGHLPMCSVTVTAENGALFFINPLFLKEHGDIWFQHSPRPPEDPREAPRCPQPAVEPGDSPPCLPQEGKQLGGSETEQKQAPETTTRAGDSSLEPASQSGGDHSQAALRRKTFVRRAAWSWGEEVESAGKAEAAREEAGGSHSFPAHYRASWLEGSSHRERAGTLTKSRSENSLYACEASLLPPICELDSLSLSSVEEDTEPTGGTSVHHRQKRHSTGLTDKVRFRLSAVGHVFTGLISSDRKVRNRIVELAQDRGSYFGNLVQGFISYTIEKKEQDTTSTEFLLEIHQMLTSLGNYLTQSSELNFLLDLTDEEGLTDTAIERALHKCVLKPLREFIFARLLIFHSRDGTLMKLKENQEVVRGQSLEQLGVTACVPDSVALEKIHSKFQAMFLLYSPRKKITHLLKACKLIYEAMSANSGKPYGADDFLPVLTYVLAFNDVSNLSLDVEYIMELLNPTELQGEGGYYLTTLFGALYHIRHFEPRTLTRKISNEAKTSIHQWHRRRTLHHSKSKRCSAKDLLYISFGNSQCDQKAIMVRENVTTADVRQLLAEKYQVNDPSGFGLFISKGHGFELLEDSCCPQRVKAELQASGERTLHFVYCPIDQQQLSAAPSEMSTQL